MMNNKPNLSVGRLLVIIAAVALSCFQISCGEQTVGKKSNLKILYVGGSADIDRFGRRDTTEQARIAQQQSVQERMAAFETMLNNYFDSVTVIHADDYVPDLSKNYDVTVMDGTPKPISPRIMERDETGRVTKVIAARYFTENFDYPMLTIGELGETLGRGIGLKPDWYCLCLDADAHSFRQEHPIFNKPFPVTMTIENKPTPEDAYHYTYYHDGPIPDSLPMWKVQTKGYKTDEGFRIGMVARPWGFEDSPEAEYISSGVCMKTLDAVAIGRHGNFLHWGFAASPANMTEEAQTVLANAIVYIAKFKGKGLIARKYDDRIATREYLKELKYLSTRESYENRLKADDVFYNNYLEQQKAALEKQAKGETLTEAEQRALNFKRPPIISFEDYIKRYQRDFFDLFGTDVEEYPKFYDANHDYFYGEGVYQLIVDEDVKSLGIPNNDKRILDEAIKMLESGKDIEKGKRILARYTLCDFATAKEWRKWYDSNKQKLFFTEAGGWLFLINSYAPGVNDYRAKEERNTVAGIKIEETDDANPVSIAAGLIKKENGNKDVVVKIKVHPGYHIYADVAKKDPFIATKVEINLPEGYEAVGTINKPAFKSYTGDTTIYEDELIFSQEIAGSGAGEIKCSIAYQCCDKHICFPPQDKEYIVKIQ